MSDMQNATQNANPTGTNPVPQNGNPQNANQQPAKVNPIVAGFRWARQKVSEGWNEIKNHPITHGLMAFGGAAAGGYAAYKLTSMANSAPAPVQPPVMIPEPKDEQTNSTTVEYVDIPENSTTPEE